MTWLSASSTISLRVKRLISSATSWPISMAKVNAPESIAVDIVNRDGNDIVKFFTHVNGIRPCPRREARV